MSLCSSHSSLSTCRKAALLLLSVTTAALGSTACASGKRWVSDSFRQSDKNRDLRIMESPQRHHQGKTQDPLGPQRAVINDSKESLSESELADAQGKRPQHGVVILHGGVSAARGKDEGRVEWVGELN